MSLFTELINIIGQKLDNNIKLNNTELSIKNKFSEYITSKIFTTTQIKTLDIGDLNNEIELLLLSEKKYIIKLLFSNNKHIFVNKNILSKIKYFDDMMDDYDFGNNCIVEIKVIQNIDYYDHMNEIINFMHDGVIYNDPIDFSILYEKLIMIDFIGQISYKDKHIMKYFLDYIITTYCDLNIKKIEHIYTILTHNDIHNIDKFITNLWITSVNLNIIDNDLFNMKFFNDIIIKSINGMQFILENKHIQYYSKIVSGNNYRIIIKDLLIIDTILSWGYIIDIITGSYNFVNSINDLLEHEFYDLITNVVFNINITKLTLDLQLKLLIKFKNMSFIDLVGTQIIDNTRQDLWTKLVKFVCGMDPNEGYKLSLLDFKSISPITCYKITYNNKIQMINIYPLKYKSWKKVGNVSAKFDDCNIVVDILLDDDKYIDNTTPIMINKKSNEPYNIGNITKIMHSSYNTTTYNEIPKITNNMLSTHCNYVFVLDKDMFNKTNIKDYIYL